MDETARRPAIYRHRPPALSPYFSDRPSSWPDDSITHTHTLTHTHTHTEKEKVKLGCKQVERKITPWDSINITGMDRSKKRKYNQRSFLFLMGPHSGRRESTLTLMLVAMTCVTCTHLSNKSTSKRNGYQTSFELGFAGNARGNGSSHNPTWWWDNSWTRGVVCSASDILLLPLLFHGLTSCPILSAISNWDAAAHARPSSITRRALSLCTSV
jgi:hypothetical protein